MIESLIDIMQTQHAPLDKKEKSQREFCGKRQKTDNLVVYEELEHGNKIPDGYKMCLNNSH